MLLAGQVTNIPSSKIVIYSRSDPKMLNESAVAFELRCFSGPAQTFGSEICQNVVSLSHGNVVLHHQYTGAMPYDRFEKVLVDPSKAKWSAATITDLICVCHSNWILLYLCDWVWIGFFFPSDFTDCILEALCFSNFTLPDSQSELLQALSACRHQIFLLSDWPMNGIINNADWQNADDSKDCNDKWSNLPLSWVLASSQSFVPVRGLRPQVCQSAMQFNVNMMCDWSF